MQCRAFICLFVSIFTFVNYDLNKLSILKLSQHEITDNDRAQRVTGKEFWGFICLRQMIFQLLFRISCFGNSSFESDIRDLLLSLHVIRSLLKDAVNQRTKVGTILTNLLRFQNIHVRKIFPLVYG